MRPDRRSLIAAAAVLPWIGGAARAGTEAGTLAALADPARPDTVMGVGVIARDGAGRVVLEAAHGSGRLTVGGSLRTRPFTLDTPMRIASITKLVAMTALMTLVEADMAAEGHGVRWSPDAPRRHAAGPRTSPDPSGAPSGRPAAKDAPETPPRPSNGHVEKPPTSTAALPQAPVLGPAEAQGGQP
jgi:hypothetical protein